MDYKNAQKLAIDYQFLVGQSPNKYEIEFVCVAPLDNDAFKVFTKNLFNTRDPKVSIMPFKNNEVIVEVIFRLD